MLYTIARLISMVLFTILFRLKVEGKENIPKRGPFILASNHLSFLDPIALGVASPRKLNFIARHDLFSFRFLGWLIAHVGAFPIKRGRPDLWAIREGLRRLHKGEALVLFPEGTRNPNGALGEGHSGVGWLALKASVPICPAFIEGTERALPIHAKCIKLKKVYIRFGIAIPPQKAVKGTRENSQAVTATVMEAIASLKIPR